MTNVIVPEKGRNFHLSADCAGLAQGWNNSEIAGNATWEPARVSFSTVVGMDKFACRRCYKAAGLTIPVQFDRKLVVGARRGDKVAAAILEAANSAAENGMVEMA